VVGHTKEQQASSNQTDQIQTKTWNSTKDQQQLQQGKERLLFLVCKKPQKNI